MKEFKPDPQGLEIGKSLTVEAGGNITGPGIIIFERGLIAGTGDIDGFNRGTCVRIMEAALRQKKNGGDLPWRELASKGVFTEDAYKAAFGV